MQKIIFEIKEEFEKELEAKTGWGKNEVKQLHDQVVIRVLSRHI